MPVTRESCLCPDCLREEIDRIQAEREVDA
jgi:hypothetical protein